MDSNRGHGPGPTPSPHALTVGETARRLSLSLSTVWRLLQRGELRRVRIGRSVRVDAQSIAAFVAQGGTNE